MAKFRLTFWKLEICNVEIEKETLHSVWIDGRRHIKRSDHSSYFDTWQEAYDELLSKVEKDFSHAQLRFDRTSKRLEAVQAMTKEGANNA